MVIFISVDNDNYVQGYGSTRGSETDIEMDLPEEHDFFKSFVTMRSYKVENGVLVKDIHKEAELLAEREAKKNKPTDQEIIQNLQEENKRLSESVDNLTTFVLMGGL